MRFPFRLFLFALALASSASLAGAKGPFDNCPDQLNAFAHAKTGEPFDLPWVGIGKSERFPFGWTRLEFRSFDAILLRAGLPVSDIEKMKGWMRLLRVEAADARELLPDEPAVLTSYALATFMRLAHEEPEFMVYAALVPDAFAGVFSQEASSRYLVAYGNFEFDDQATVFALRRVTSQKFHLQRPMQAVLLRDIHRDSTEASQQEWLADLMAAMQRRSDFIMLSSAFSRDLHLKLPWLGERIGKRPDGKIALASPTWPLVIETRAELVRAWTLHRLRGGDWDEQFFESQQRAVDHVRPFTTAEVLEPYLSTENGVYWDHTMAIMQAIRAMK